LLFMSQSASAFELKSLTQLKDLMPCRSAAIRLCDRSQGINDATLWRCGATLASHLNEVGQRCMDVLKRYGQI
jgi:hypothetical protein